MSQTLQRQTNQMSVRLVFWGVAIGVVGAILRKHAENVGDFVGVLGERLLRISWRQRPAIGEWACSSSALL
jgi:hypothetical protein